MKYKNINRYIRFLPNFLWPVKGYLIKKSFGACGKNVKINYASSFNHQEKIYIDDNVFINERFYCSVSKKLTIGKRVMFGPDVMIIGGDHNFNKVGEFLRYIPESDEKNHEIIIENDAWIGSRVTILKKVKIGEGAIVGSCSLVLHDIPPYVIAFGNPAKTIKPRFNQVELKEHLEKINSKYHIEDLIYIYD